MVPDILELHNLYRRNAGWYGTACPKEAENELKSGQSHWDSLRTRSLRGADRFRLLGFDLQVINLEPSRMLFRMPRLTPGYIRYLQTQAALNFTQGNAGDKTMPRLAMFMGALGIGMCSYSSKQLALHHRPSTRVWRRAGPHGESTPSSLTHRLPTPAPTNLSRRTSVDIQPPTFAVDKVPK